MSACRLDGIPGVGTRVELTITESVSIATKSSDFVVYTWTPAENLVDGRVFIVPTGKPRRSTSPSRDIVNNKVYARIRTKIPFKTAAYTFTTLEDYHDPLSQFARWNLHVVTTLRATVLAQFRKNRGSYLDIEIAVPKEDLKAKPSSRRSPTSWSHILDPMV